MTCFVYVIKSKRDGVRYIGITGDIQKRLRQHEQGENRFTKGHRPWILVYQEKYNSRSGAMKQEKFLKSGQGRKWLDKILCK